MLNLQYEYKMKLMPKYTFSYYGKAKVLHKENYGVEIMAKFKIFFWETSISMQNTTTAPYNEQQIEQIHANREHNNAKILMKLC